MFTDEELYQMNFSSNSRIIRENISPFKLDDEYS